MTDTPPGDRLDEVLRSVQRLSDRVDEYRVRSRAEVAHVNEVVTAMARAVDVLLREHQQLRSEMEDVRRLSTDVALREDVRRGVDRVVASVSSAEQAVASEVRAVDARVGSLADDVRLVRVLRDGLDALTDGVDGIRQLAARTATSQQMTEVTRELGAVLHEIERARTQVLQVDQPAPSTVITVGSDVDELGRRMDALAEQLAAPAAAAPSEATQLVAERLRRMSDVARQLGNGVLEDMRARRRAARR